MNEITTVEPSTYGLVPTTMTEAIKLAEMMANAKLVPQALQKSPADCLMVIQQAVRWNMDCFAVAQECSVIQGKLMHSGKLVAAVVNARGNLANRLAFSYEGEGDERTITVTGRLQNEAEARTVSVRLKDAKTSNRVWQTQPDQQLMYHGTRVWARRHTPELMLGVWSPEEFDEPTSTPAKKPPHPKPLKLATPQQPQEPQETVDQETGELIGDIIWQDEPESERGGIGSPPASPAAPAPNPTPAQTGVGAAPSPPLSLEDMAREAAMHGEAQFRLFYKSRTPPERGRINAIGDELRALMADVAKEPSGTP